MLSALILAGIIVSSLNQFVITFRDVGLLLAAIALFLLPDGEQITDSKRVIY